MEAGERTISQILTEQIRYEIPAYQRPYSWEKGNVEQLLDDVWEAYVANDEEYFIGSLITIEREKGRLYDVVDGQQRLTTLNLIFSRLRDAVDEPAKSELGRRVLPRNALTGEEETPRLTLRQRDQNFFRRHVLAGEVVPEALRKEVAKEQDAPKQRIIENLEAIDSFIAQHDQKTLKLFANYLLSRVYVVFVTTASWQSAYRLFNVLNARGMALSNADLIKNMLFARLGGNAARSSDLDEAWLELEEQIGIERLDQFMAHHRSSIVATKARKALHEEFEPLIATAATPFTFLDEVNTSARNYLRVLRNEFEAPAARRAVRSLKRVAFEEWIPPLLAFLNRPVADMPEGEFIDLLERITYQNWIRRLAFTARLTAYFQLITAIRAGKNADDIRAIFRANANDDEFRSLLDGEVYGRPFAQAVLLRLEEADQDESVTKDFGGKITIEHVLPQALKDAYWRERFTDDDHRLWLHRLGNLALLAGIKNYKAQYFPFDRKKKIYAERNNRVSFDTTKPILSADHWTKDLLAARQADLVDRAQRIWSLSKSGTA
ncbi:DUF262 domain-containing protein [Paracoccus sp. MC1854]|jgi:hypothetical protein|uniref:DUF262 domain-containing protein n=1 Tax=Paracoccus sp. MC1854 TaxID=2760306 RepID=UPI0016007ED0|nr:DUF262 domain-containing protein [Paracoccus sp. MC1854]MBB1492987.1 DUF262 domain-containing protein [Paracoccus sp. MC1854]